MDIKEKIETLEEILDVEEGSLSPDTVLADLDEWDSITRLSLLIYFDEELGKKVSGDEIKAFEKVEDILGLMD